MSGEWFVFPNKGRVSPVGSHISDFRSLQLVAPMRIAVPAFIVAWLLLQIDEKLILEQSREYR